MQEELKPCPFCGGNASVWGAFSVGPGKKLEKYVRCDECGARSDMFFVYIGSNPDAVVKKAVKAWNRRMKEEPCE